MSFSADLRRVSTKLGTSLDQTRRAVIVELYGSVILDTPVDTGRARGNWQTSVGQPVGGVIARDDKGGSAATAQVSSNLGKLGDTVFMSNNLPYIEGLEEGDSKQAPAGMVRKNFARIQAILRAKAK